MHQIKLIAIQQEQSAEPLKALRNPSASITIDCLSDFEMTSVLNMVGSESLFLKKHSIDSLSQILTIENYQENRFPEKAVFLQTQHLGKIIHEVEILEATHQKSGLSRPPTEKFLIDFLNYCQNQKFSLVCFSDLEFQGYD